MRTEIDTHILNVPAPGDWTLQLLSPSILELTQISTKARDLEPGRAVSGLEIRVGAQSQKLKIASAGWKRRPIYAPLATPKDFRIATQLYLKLAEPLDLEKVS